jgi:hypothetical protein
MFVKGREKTGGKKKGSKNKSTLLFQGLLEKDKVDLLKVAIKLAKEGNATIMNKLLDKMLPNIESEAAKNPFVENKPKTITVEYV